MLIKRPTILSSGGEGYVNISLKAADDIFRQVSSIAVRRGPGPFIVVVAA